MGEIILKGNPVDPGIVVGQLCMAGNVISYSVPQRYISAKYIAEEKSRFNNSITNVIKNYDKIIEYTARTLGKPEAEIFKSHIAILKDPTLIKSINTEIDSGKNAEWAIHNAFSIIMEKFLSIANPYIAQRVHDLEDVMHQLISDLCDCIPQSVCENIKGCGRFGAKAIIAVQKLKPSLVIRLAKQRILGFVVEGPVTTSHGDILAKSLRVPIISNVKGLTKLISCGRTAVLDANKGVLIIDPQKETIRSYNRVLTHTEIKEATLDSRLNSGESIKLQANVGSLEAIQDLKTNNLQGIGLLRTEFLFFARNSFPTEKEQIKIYRKIAADVKSHQITIRLLDIGGDKFPPYLKCEDEENPFLGVRGSRFLLKNTSILKVQLRAILQANTYKNFRIMLPMISCIEEVIKIRKIYKTVIKELTKEKNSFNEIEEFGLLVEVPSIAFMLNIIKDYADFFSLGTNDLIQYMMAADRNNPEVSEIYNKISPAFVRLIKHFGEFSLLNKKEVSICGEIGSDPKILPLLIGLGIRAFSIAPKRAPIVKKVLNSITLKDCTALANRILKARSSNTIEKILNKFYLEKN